MDKETQVDPNKILFMTLIGEKSLAVTEENIFRFCCDKNVIKKKIDVLIICSEKTKINANNLKNTISNSSCKKAINKIYSVFFDNIESIREMQNSLENTVKEIYSYVFLDITGGNKLMALATYQYAKNKFNKNLISIYKNSESDNIINVDNGRVLTLDNQDRPVSKFFDIAGIHENQYNSKKPMYNSLNNYIDLFYKFINGFKEAQHSLIQIYKNKEPKFKHCFNLLEDLKAKKIPEQKINLILDYLEFIKINPNSVSKKEYKFVTGGWFEDFIYHYIKEINNLQEDEILLDVTILKDNFPNEFDAIYIDNSNVLNIVECKTGVGFNDKTGLASSDIYKVKECVNRIFGIDKKFNIHFFTLSTIAKNSPLINLVKSLSNSSDCKIELYDIEEILNRMDNYKNIIKDVNESEGYNLSYLFEKKS